MRHKTIHLSEKKLHKLNQKTYLIWVYMDLAEKGVTDIDSICQQKDIKRQIIKQKLNKMQKTAETFREEINKTFETNPDKIEMFGEMCDDIEVQFKTDLYHSLKIELGL